MIIQDTQTILVTSTTSDTCWGKVVLMNKCTYNSFQGGDWIFKGLGWGQCPAIEMSLKPGQVFHPETPKGCTPIEVCSPLDRGRRTSEEEDSLRPKLGTETEAGLPEVPLGQATVPQLVRKPGPGVHCVFKPCLLSGTPGPVLSLSPSAHLT